MRSNLHSDIKTLVLDLWDKDISIIDIEKQVLLKYQGTKQYKSIKAFVQDLLKRKCREYIESEEYWAAQMLRDVRHVIDNGKKKGQTLSVLNGVHTQMKLMQTMNLGSNSIMTSSSGDDNQQIRFYVGASTGNVTSSDKIQSTLFEINTEEAEFEEVSTKKVV